MTRNLVCSECGGTMQIGYIPDASYTAILISSWIEGKVERNFRYRTNTSKFRHCEEGVLPDEAVPVPREEIASGRTPSQ
jgi:hypothetical protein